MKETLVLETPAEGEISAPDPLIYAAETAAETWRGMSRRARRALLAATFGSSLAILLSPALLAKHGGLHKHKAAKPGLTRASDAPRREKVAQARAEALETAKTRRKLFAAVSSCRESLSEGQRWRIVDAIHQEAKRHGYDPLFVMALVEVESTCSPTANSKRGAVGLTQIKPSTARAVAKDLGVPWAGRSTLVQEKMNLRLGLTYLAQLEEKFGDPFVAMAAYNLGPARVSGMSRHRAQRSRYVKKILARYEGLLLEHSAQA